MKTKSFLLCLIAFFTTACTTKHYEIKGSISLENENIEDTVVYLKKQVIREWITLDSAVVKNNTFSFTGDVDKALVAYCTYNSQTIPVVLESGEISINISETPSVSGTKENDLLYNFYAETTALRDNIDVQFNNEIINGFSQDEAMSNIQPLIDESTQMQIDFILANINKPVANFVFTGIYYQLNIEQKEAIISKLNNKSKLYDRIPMIIEALETEKKTSVGQQYTDIALNNVEGNVEKLSDLVGKSDYVLVTFWASWCPPCVRSFSGLTPLYNKYKGSNKLEILGVSLDNDKKNWVGAIARHNLTWHHISDLKEWESAGAQMYAINSIPTTVLIDKSGQIVARNPSLTEIEAFIAK